jgi:DNA-directed RNA polymerase specialized sigma24 family protein
MSQDENIGKQAHEAIAAVYSSDSRHVFATLIRLLGDFDVAEEALHDTFRAALEQWPREGVPANPRAWLVSAGRFKAIDGIRRHARFESLPNEIEVRRCSRCRIFRPIYKKPQKSFPRCSGRPGNARECDTFQQDCN